MSQKRIRSRIVFSVLIPLLVCGSFFLPEIVSTYCHARFGDSTTFHGWRIPVLRGWYAVTRNDLLIIQKATRFYDSEDAPTITPDILSPGKPVDPERLKQASIQVISKQGFLFQEERPFRIGTDSGYCYILPPTKTRSTFTSVVTHCQRNFRWVILARTTKSRLFILLLAR